MPTAIADTAPSPRGHALGSELKAPGALAYADDIERRIAYQLAEEVGAPSEHVGWQVFYGVVKQSRRKIARRMVRIYIGAERSRPDRTFLAQRCEPEGERAWYTIGAELPCRGRCGRPVLRLAGAWEPTDGAGQELLHPNWEPQGEVAHVGCWHPDPRFR